MENQLPTYKEVRKALKPYLDKKSEWNESAVKVYKQNEHIIVKVCFYLVYKEMNNEKHPKRYILTEVREYLTKAGFTDEGSGNFKRKINLVDSKNSLIFVS